MHFLVETLRKKRLTFMKKCFQAVEFAYKPILQSSYFQRRDWDLCVTNVIGKHVTPAANPQLSVAHNAGYAFATNAT